MAEPKITFEPGRRDPAAMRRRYRNGTAAKDPACRMIGALPVEVRNGLPEFRPYVYRGTGADTLTAWMGGDDA